MKTSSCIQRVIDYIIESEMVGREDNRFDPYYTLLEPLRELKNKTEDEEHYICGSYE